ncbi:MAG TPA: 50S ribosomal protein L35 [Myxococcales bacterium]|jgi:large subunit ribosomal protein L35|nr:50S ribosomal protein L35 [Myxococcales bacterium]HIL81422.1 50S ribosomal protein L35 [Myxococcales bacterium]
MPKMKSHKGSAKRFSRTGTGKIKRHKAMKNHMLGCKTTKRKRQLRAADVIAKADMSRVERLLPYL